MNIETLKEKAEAGDTNAMFLLAKAYAKMRRGTSDLPNFQVYHWLSKSAELGDAISQYELGRIYFWNHFGIQSDKKAVFWWEKAAMQGNANAKSSLQGMASWGNELAIRALKALREAK